MTICLYPKNLRDLEVSELKHAIMIADRKVLLNTPKLKRWAARFAGVYDVRAGEDLKDLGAFPRHVANIERLTHSIPSADLSIYAVGGGSVGDFSGFFASTYRRGVKLVNVPTTWLAAIDSSHGGKTALNTRGIKNQIGTFYPATRVMMVQEILYQQPTPLIQEALSELAKIAIISGGDWVSDLVRLAPTTHTPELLWRMLPSAVEAKMHVVRADPYELKGRRQILNLGHTVGHVIESALGWSHGRAVAAGLFFATEYSRHSGRMTGPAYRRIMSLLTNTTSLKRPNPEKISESVFLKLLGADKKRSSKTHVNFVFPKRIGQVSREPVDFRELLIEARRQGWLR